MTNIDLDTIKDASAFSDIMYATQTGSPYSGSCYDKLTSKLGERKASGHLKGDWNVHEATATHHYAIFVNDDQKKAYIVARGSTSLWSDWINNDIFGFLGLYGTRSIRIKDATAEIVQILIEKGYDVIGTGHSLGGSVMRCVAAAFGIKVITFNAPFLQHDPSFNSKMRSNNAGNVINVIMYGDVICSIASPELSFDSQMQTQLLLMNGTEVGCIEAHSMEKLCDALKDGKIITLLQPW